LTALLVVWVVLLSLSCSSVTTVQPLPWKVEPGDQERFEGTWLVGDDSLQIRFAGGDMARFAGLEWEDGQFQLEQGEMIICHGKHLTFLSVRTREDGTWMDRYYLVQYKFTDTGELVLWLPDVDAFADTIAQNRLEGTVDGDGSGTDVTITSGPDALLALIDVPDDRALFDYREPIILKKVVAWYPPNGPSEPVAGE